MAVIKSRGTTPSERLLSDLCEKSFLGFWSYANVYRNQGGPKELCDLLVVCDNDILIFSDKSCAFPNSGDLKVDWSRWYRKSIAESAKQVLGAERWLKQHPDRVYLDNKCDQPLPISVMHAPACKFFRIVVALGAQDRCRKHLGGTGSLALSPLVVGKAHYDQLQNEVHPFVVGFVDEQRNFIHVFDDVTLPLLLKELDTITDFIAYLNFKEHLFQSGKLGVVRGEENLLGIFLSRFVNSDAWRSRLESVTQEECIEVGTGTWGLFTESEFYLDSKSAFRASYIWDSIIQQFSFHAFGGTLFSGSEETIASNEEIFRSMAREPRMARGFLVDRMMDRWSQSRKGQVDYRIVASPCFDDTLYVYVFVPNEFKSFEEYREIRQEYLRNYCFLVASKNRRFRQVVGIASDAGDQPYRTFDVVRSEVNLWTPEMESTAATIEKQTGVTGAGFIHRFEQTAAEREFVERVAKRAKVKRHRDSRKIGRNDPCPCGSGRKFKRCCLRSQS